MKSYNIDWGDSRFSEHINFTCPHCDGQYDGVKPWRALNENEIDEVRNAIATDQDMLNCYYLEHRDDFPPEWDDDCDALDDEQKAEISKNLERDEYIPEDEIKSFYERDIELFGFYCEECSDGYLEPMMNYAYPVDCDCNEDNRRTASELGLFLFEDPNTNQVAMSLMGGGMDLSPSILQTYLALTGRIPLEWAMEFQTNYCAGVGLVGGEYHRKVAKACLETLMRHQEIIGHKIGNIADFLQETKDGQPKGDS